MMSITTDIIKDTVKGVSVSSILFLFIDFEVRFLPFDS